MRYSIKDRAVVTAKSELIHEDLHCYLLLFLHSLARE